MKNDLLPLLERAITIAVEAHRGNTDKAGAPYILHPLRVMHRVESVEEKIVAILHDVVEDTDWTFEKLRSEGFPDRVLAALDGVTRRNGESYDDFIQRAASHPVARRVKIADLEDNMDIKRYETLTDDGIERLRKYRKALSELGDPCGNEIAPVNTEYRINRGCEIMKHYNRKAGIQPARVLQPGHRGRWRRNTRFKRTLVSAGATTGPSRAMAPQTEWPHKQNVCATLIGVIHCGAGIQPVRVLQPGHRGRWPHKQNDCVTCNSGPWMNGPSRAMAPQTERRTNRKAHRLNVCATHGLPFNSLPSSSCPYSP